MMTSAVRMPENLSETACYPRGNRRGGDCESDGRGGALFVRVPPSCSWASPGENVQRSASCLISPRSWAPQRSRRVSEPSMRRRNRQTCCENQKPLVLLGQACRGPDDRARWPASWKRVADPGFCVELRERVVPMSRKTPKWLNPPGESTDAEHRD